MINGAVGDNKFCYTGYVTVKLKIKDKVFELSKHNSGLSALFRIFAMALCGYNVSQSAPVKLDLRGANVAPTDSNINLFTSCLPALVPLTGVQYFQEDDIWKSRFTATIPYSFFLAQKLSMYTNKILVLTGLSDDLAYLSISEGFEDLTEGTELIISWDMYVDNV